MNPPKALAPSRLIVRTCALTLCLIVAGLLIGGEFVRRSLNLRALETATRKAIAQRDFADANAKIQTLEQTRPQLAETDYLRAMLAMAQDQPDLVLVHLKNARDRGYPQPPMNRLVGLIHARAKRSDQAETLLRTVWDEHDGPDPDVADALCRIYVESFRFKPALEVVDRWIRENPDDLRALLWRAEIHSRNDPGLDVQIRDYDAILAIAEDHHASRIARANALRQVGRFQEAGADYDRYLRVHPDHAEALFGAAKTAEGLDDVPAALLFYDRILRQDPENVLGLLGKSAILLDRNDPKGAISLLDVAIAKVPHDPEPRYRRGQALMRLGRSAEAEIDFAERRRLQSDQEQIEKLRKGLVRDPGNVKLMAEAASWLIAHGYHEQGLEWARKALAAQPSHVSILNLLIGHYERQGNLGLANYYRSQLPVPHSP